MSYRRWLWIIFVIVLPTAAADRGLPKPIVGLICLFVAAILLFICCYPICRYRQRQLFNQRGVVYQQPAGVNVIPQTGPLQYPSQSYSATTVYPANPMQQTPVYPPTSAPTQPYPPYPLVGATTQPPYPGYPPVGVGTQQAHPPYPTAPPTDTGNGSSNIPPPAYSSLFPLKQMNN